ncbi:MAG: hypothetical protein KF878_04340 [Planctomycetes bacterium]|nr:hypothetical protein [Planctomycetota bacterium]
MTKNSKTTDELENEATAKLASIMARAPDVRDAVQRLGMGDHCRKVFGAPTFFVDPNSNHDLSKWIMIGALSLRVEELQEHLREIKGKAEIACAGEKNWHFAFAARDKLIFANNVGDHAEMPIDVAHAIFVQTPADCRLRKGKTKVTFLRGDRRVARIPKSLFSHLNKVLESVPWTTLVSRQVQPPAKGKA